MPAKGSCCCSTPDTHGLATMWILDFHYGDVIRDFNHAELVSASTACAFDEALVQACEIRLLWDAVPPESLIWGPVTQTSATRSVGGFSPSYFWHGGLNVLAGPADHLAAVARSDGSNYVHGMTGGLLRTDGTHIYTAVSSNRTLRKYSEDGTLVASQTGSSTGAQVSYSGQGEHYRFLTRGFPDNDRIYTAYDPTSLALNWTLDLNNPNNSGIEGNDEAGGMYLVFGGNIVKYSGGALVYSAAEPTSFGASTTKFGGNGNMYYTRSITGVVNLTKVDGSTGSIAWNTPLPFTPTSLLSDHQNVVHDGVVYIPHAGGIWAIDEASGSTLWHNTTQVCGYSRPVPTTLGLLCSGLYS